MLRHCLTRLILARAEIKAKIHVGNRNWNKRLCTIRSTCGDWRPPAVRLTQECDVPFRLSVWSEALNGGLGTATGRDAWFFKNLFCDTLSLFTSKIFFLGGGMNTQIHEFQKNKESVGDVCSARREIKVASYFQGNLMALSIQMHQSSGAVCPSRDTFGLVIPLQCNDKSFGNFASITVWKTLITRRGWLFWMKVDFHQAADSSRRRADLRREHSI